MGMHLPEDDKTVNQELWVHELQNRYDCCICSRIFLPAELFICEVCAHLMCDSCARYHGKWAHLQQMCPHCSLTEGSRSHTLYFVCDSICERELYTSGPADFAIDG